MSPHDEERLGNDVDHAAATGETLQQVGVCSQRKRFVVPADGSECAGPNHEGRVGRRLSPVAETSIAPLGPTHLPGGVHEFDVHGSDDVRIWMRVEPGNLLFQPARLVDVVRVRHGDQRTTCLANTDVTRRKYTDVSVQTDDSDTMVARCARAQNRQRVVVRPVVDDDELKVSKCLREHAVDGALDESRRVVRAHDHRNSWSDRVSAHRDGLQPCLVSVHAPGAPRRLEPPRRARAAHGRHFGSAWSNRAAARCRHP